MKVQVRSCMYAKREEAVENIIHSNKILSYIYFIYFDSIKIITMTDLNFKQDSIKDKMRSIPIEVSTNILGTKRVRAKNGLPQLTPILDASQPSKDATEVNNSDINIYNQTHSIIKVKNILFTVEQNLCSGLLLFCRCCR